MAATRKLYRALAHTLGTHDVPFTAVNAVASALADDNPRFSKRQFVDAVDAARPPIPAHLLPREEPDATADHC